jgi:hypothetical protein
MTEASTHQEETASLRETGVRQRSSQLEEISKKVVSHTKSLAPKGSEQRESYQEAQQVIKQHNEPVQESEKKELEPEDVQQSEAGRPIPAAQESQQHEPSQATSEASKTPDEEICYKSKEVLFLK